MNSNDETSSHEFYRQLCALMGVGDLNHEEQESLSAHLKVCPECRFLVREYNVVLAACASTASSDRRESQRFPLLHATRLRRSKKQLFARIDAQDSVPCRTSVQWVFGASWITAGLAIVIAGFVGYLVGANRPRPEMPRPAAAATITRDDQGQLEGQLAEARAEIQRETQEKRDLQAALAKATSEIAALGPVSTERDELRVTLVSLRQELTSSENTRSALDGRVHQLESSAHALEIVASDAQAKVLTEANRATALQAELVEARVFLKDAEARASSSEEYLASDRDIRELMGARDLYMADVIDVDRNGKSAQAQGRIFYTKGKSLVFYAFDLDKQPHQKNAVFQVWGVSGPRTQTVPIKMGIFYLDSGAHNRWVMKFDDPRDLARIDSVFVTVEPEGGSSKPSGRQLMFASLQNEPNHP